MHRRFVSKLLIYSLLTLYLTLDVLVLEGPLYHSLKHWGVTEQQQVANDRARGVVARVFQRPIYRSQVEWKVDELLWNSGQKRDDLSENVLKNYRKIAVDKLVDAEILREKVKLHKSEHPVPAQELDAAMQRFVSRFSNEEEMLAVMKAQGIESVKEMKLRVEAMLQQESYLEERLTSSLEVTEEEILEWLAAHKEHYYLAERRKVRHIFLAALGHSEHEALAELKKMRAQLLTGETSWKELAGRSEDERSKWTEGDLGWMSAERLAQLDAEFAAQVFELPLRAPQIIPSEIGWHLLEVLESEPQQPRTLEDSKVEVQAAIRAERRPEIIRVYRQNLRRRHQRYVKIDWESLGWK